MSARRVFAGVIAFWLLACTGATDGTTPAPEPKPAPKPKAPNAGECQKWQGVSLPLTDGTIVACSATSVKVDHPGAAGREVRWDYSVAFQGAGWMLMEPTKGDNPTVSKGGKTVVFSDQGSAVIMNLR